MSWYEDMQSYQAYWVSRCHRFRDICVLPYHNPLPERCHPCVSCQIRKIVGCACAGNARNVTHVPWWVPGSLIIGFLSSRWRGKRSRHFRRMRNPQIYLVSGPCLNVGSSILANGDISLFNSKCSLFNILQGNKTQRQDKYYLVQT